MSQVLVIDADTALRTTLDMLLQDAGYAVTATASPASALEHLRASADAMVVLFDAGIPRVSEGQVTALAMTNDPRLRRHAYICMTTSLALMHPDLHGVLSSLAVPIIEKPFEVDALLAMVDEAASMAGGPPHHPPQ